MLKITLGEWLLYVAKQILDRDKYQQYDGLETATSGHSLATLFSQSPAANSTSMQPT